MDRTTDIEELLEKPYWVVDILPRQVPAESPGRFFDVERFFLEHPQIDDLKAHRLSLLLKLQCYYDLRISTDVCETWTENPSPEELREALDSCLYVLFPLEGALITADPGDIYMTLYNPSKELLQLVRQLAASEGLFVWQPPQE